jgi:malonate transporter MadL subunit
VALLAVCTLLGALAGDLLGAAIGVRNNVGGVGIAMLLLVAVRMWLARRDGETPPGVKAGVGFWAAMYIPIVVAMAASQNVVAALRGGPAVAVAAVLAVTACFVGVPLLAGAGRPKPASA